jgi:hypothetical protein
MKYLSAIGQFFTSESHNDPMVRIAEVEYNKEFRWFVKSNGRRPTRDEALSLMGR